MAVYTPRGSSQFFGSSVVKTSWFSPRVRTYAMSMPNKSDEKQNLEEASWRSQTLAPICLRVDIACTGEGSYDRGKKNRLAEWAWFDGLLEFMK